MFKSIIATFLGLYLFYLFINAIVEDIKYKRDFKVKVDRLAKQLDEIDWEDTDSQMQIVQNTYNETTKKIDEYEPILEKIINPKESFLNKI